MKRLQVSGHLLNVAVNLAVPGITIRALSRRLGTSTALTQHILFTLITQGRVFETHSTKKTTYHAVRVFVNRVAAALRPSVLYARMLKHMRKFAHRRWPLREMAQQLHVTVEEMQTEVDRGLGLGTVNRSQVGALALYGLA